MNSPPTITLFRAPRRIRRPIDRTLNMARDTILARIELTSNYSVFTKWAADRLADLANCAVRVELLAD
jgi:hypothetical protein